MKISVSLPEADVAFLDEYGAKTSSDSRSAVIHAAIELLRAAQLEDDYQQAWQEWGRDESTSPWEDTMEDGLSDAAR
ncbi:antitoxin [Kitasatospora sp. GAS204B]|uniref:antitoxin n=1 Tax=unclassified Kitasatospora TaxID=2633591 RepID=UPI0024736BFB|nr:antitoxin [Kitasatospora sp. GAS204B]MDH6120172.1 Arc/MetJ-type ribon-helix-helix transcriptional regulator [Kitasatospora sp. GAS204B]